MNPDSDSIIELGTIEHPYKQISYAFIELLNYHSHTDRNITIYVMEYTRNELSVGVGSIINITHVVITPYTLRSVDPDKAIIVGRDEAEILATPSTSFSIMKSYEYRFDEKVSNRVEISDLEKTKITLEAYLFVFYRSSASFINLEMQSEYANVYADIALFYAVYLQYKQATYKDLHLRTSGAIMRTYDPLFLHIENIDLDYYRNQGGFDMMMS